MKNLKNAETKKMKISSPAFPTYLADNMAHGMLLRDYFAASVISKIIEMDLTMSEKDQRELKFLVKVAYRIADAMLAERDQ
jgi:hypothetical protein